MTVKKSISKLFILCLTHSHLLVYRVYDQRIQKAVDKVPAFFLAIFHHQIGTTAQHFAHAHKLAEQGKEFKDLARQYSNLPSAADGGDLGFFKKNEMATYMRDAVTALQPGAISPIIERPDSYMFFKILSNGQEKEGKERVLDENIKEEIRNKLYKQEAEERYKKWLERIREEAYIKIL